MSTREDRTAGPDPAALTPGDCGDLPPEAVDGLLAAAARGNDSAFNLVLSQLSGRIQRLVRTVVPDPAQAEEVTQEVLFEMWRTAVRYDSSKGSAAAWALTIARRRAIDRVRSTAASSAREQRSAMAVVSRDVVSEAVQENLDREQLQACLDRLSNSQLQVVILAFYGGYAHAEIATLLGIPLGTVKARIRGALARLRGCMEAGS